MKTIPGGLGDSLADTLVGSYLEFCLGLCVRWCFEGIAISNLCLINYTGGSRVRCFCSGFQPHSSPAVSILSTHLGRRRGVGTQSLLTTFFTSLDSCLFHPWDHFFNCFSVRTRKLPIQTVSWFLLPFFFQSLFLWSPVPTPPFLPPSFQIFSLSTIIQHSVGTEHAE